MYVSWGFRVGLYPFPDNIHEKLLKRFKAITRSHQVIDRGNKITMTLFLQILIDIAHIPCRQLLCILPFEFNLPLHLADVSEQILKLCRLGSEK